MKPVNLPSWHKEIIDLHDFFQAWNNGTISNSQESLMRVKQVWRDDFSIIFSNGQICNRQEVLKQLERDYACDPDFRIEIQNVHLRWKTYELVLVFYEEWHIDGDEIEARSCSALLQAQEDSPNGWIWLHIHESPLRYASKTPN